MREILFRGKTENDIWYYGDLLNKGFDCNTAIWEEDESFMVEVIPETIGQFTGLMDKNGNKIFEGDIVKVRQYRDDGVGVIGYEHGSFVVYVMSGDIYERTLFEYWYNDWDLEIVGNKHDNSDLKPESIILQKGWR